MSTASPATPHTLLTDGILLDPPPPIAPSMRDSTDGLNSVPDSLTEKPRETSVTPMLGGRKSFRLLLIGGLIALIVVVLAVILPVYFVVIRPKQNTNSNLASVPTGAPSQSANAPTPTSSGGSQTSAGLVIGGDGTLVTASDGSTFTYRNPFGGYFVTDAADPYNNAAKAQSWTPALNETWRYGTDLIHGVNLGEPFIAPALFQKYQNGTIVARDEWTLSQAMRADTSPGGGISQLETHYQEFITEKDFADIAGAGLNWLRIPIPFWAIDVWNDEPFLEGVCWKYILQAFAWARKYGLRIYLDLHTVPVYRYNHSGKLGQINFLNGVMGLANAERTLGYIRTITEFISQPEYRDVIPMFGIVNEALLTTIGRESLTSFYLEAHNMMRSITGDGAGHGPYLVIHDAFGGLSSWQGFLPNSDRIALDTHPYVAFDGQPNTQPLSDFATIPCNGWAPGINSSQLNFGVTVAGEFSNAVNDCGLWIRGVGGQPTYPDDCSVWQDASKWDSSVVSGLKQFMTSSMDSLQNYFFWTWKIGNSSISNKVESPLWSYQLGLQVGVIPTDPREAYGACSSLGVDSGSPFRGTYSAWQTGGAGAGTIAPSLSSEFPWPPASIAGVEAVSLLPTYTNTGPIETLPMPTFTFSAQGQVSTVSAGSGWLNPQDTQPGVTPVAGCTYPDPWDATDAPLPTAACTGRAAKKRTAFDSAITPAP
ncbi:glycoside hydrolase family 5 protein [Hysterangium stoloniferum]|nr:glycoside hydrolase family 5 protein [Hysterangium stoloniferum]